MGAMKELQWFCERLDSKHIINKFLRCVPKTRNTILQSCFVLYTQCDNVVTSVCCYLLSDLDFLLVRER